MTETILLLAPELWAPVPAAEPVSLLEQLATLLLENLTLRAENAVLQQRTRELEAQPSQNFSNSSRPPSTDLPQTPPWPKAPPYRRKRRGQPGHRGACRGLLRVDAVDEIVPAMPEHCRQCQQPFRGIAAPRRARV